MFEHITDSIASREAVKLRKLLTGVSDMIPDLMMFYFPRYIVQDERELTPEHDPDYVQRFEVWEKPREILLISDMITGTLFWILDPKSMIIYMECLQYRLIYPTTSWLSI